jgi:hypothetical protein
MARKPVQRMRASGRHGRQHANGCTRLHLPQTQRTITARKLRNTPSEHAQHAQRREVPEIRLSGAWLERIGFVKGRRYLISVDREIDTIYLSAEIVRPERRKR